jgi:hypothetical protein
LLPSQTPKNIIIVAELPSPEPILQYNYFAKPPEPLLLLLGLLKNHYISSVGGDRQVKKQSMQQYVRLSCPKFF